MFASIAQSHNRTIAQSHNRTIAQSHNRTIAQSHNRTNLFADFIRELFLPRYDHHHEGSFTA
ncbi:hypothetical protein [Bartonella vinsonii]|uniref:hypothetical protein n=1 Tax=Bartonella vinsonii TaxID=33047 RepID=UPI0004B431EA|nr:hypothetical protein [Bartonella vinsonii]